LEKGELLLSEPKVRSLATEVFGLTELESLEISPQQSSNISTVSSEVFTPEMMEWINDVLEKSTTAKRP
jgi:hypothetical protein